MMTSQTLSTREMIDRSYYRTPPLRSLSAVSQPAIPASVPEEISRVLSIHRALLKEALEDSAEDGNERAFTICGPRTPVTSDLIEGGPTSVSAPTCGVGDLTVAVHTHPDMLGDPLLSIADMTAVIDRDFDWVIALGSSTSEGITSPNAQQLQQLREAGIERGLELASMGTRTAAQQQKLREIHDQIRELDIVTRFNTGWIGARVPSVFGIKRLVQGMGDTTQPIPIGQVFWLLFLFVVLWFGMTLFAQSFGGP